MPAVAPPSPVDVRPNLSVEEFYADYVNTKPVLLKGALANLPAAERWSLPYFASVAPDLEVRLKTGRVAEGNTTTMRLADYAKAAQEWEDSERVGDPPGYLHDVPLLTLIPELRADLEPFPRAIFPSFFAKRWWVFPQFFVGPSVSQTPLHFDTLLTHNLFFQLSGRKRFLMVAASDRERCYPYKWRWSPVDPDQPDLERFPKFAGVATYECFVEGGDLFYMPPGTLHKVTSLTSSVSFNIDWHDRTSVVRGLAAARHGMPPQNVRYNALFGLGMCGVPLKALMPALRSYFTYIS